MRAVTNTPDGVQLNFMFLPTFIGFNSLVKAEIERLLVEKFSGSTVNDHLLNKMHLFVLDHLCTKFPIKGLRKYLEAMTSIEEEG